jgi:hypothetical protein
MSYGKFRQKRIVTGLAVALKSRQRKFSRMFINERKGNFEMTTDKKDVNRTPEPEEKEKVQKPYKCQMFLRYYGP